MTGPALATLMAALSLMPCLAGAETLIEAYGLGPAKAVPEEWTKINQELSIRARIVDAASGETRGAVRAGDKLALALDFYVQPGAKDRKISLTCGHFFYNAEGEAKGKEAKDIPCYSGRLSDGAERFQPLSYRYEFTLGPSAVKGTWALIARVEDQVIKDGIALAPTFTVKEAP